MNDRFLKFTISISKLNKLIQKLKTDGMRIFDLKGVHTLCMYQLLENPTGLTSSKIAVACDLDPALVSRTISHLLKDGLIQKQKTVGKTYYAKYLLTDKGLKIATELRSIIHHIQVLADADISEDELAVFYNVLNRLLANFEAMTDESNILF